MDHPALPRHSTIDEASPQFRRIKKLALFNFYAQLIANGYGLFWAHSILVGWEWNQYPGHPSALVMAHLMWPPTVLFLLFSGWYGAFRLRARTLWRFRFYVLVALISLGLFTLYELLLFQKVVMDGHPSWAPPVLYPIVPVMTMGMFVLFTLYGWIDRILHESVLVPSGTRAHDDRVVATDSER